jgi:hypothetical protein
LIVDAGCIAEGDHPPLAFSLGPLFRLVFVRLGDDQTLNRQDGLADTLKSGAELDYRL